MKYFIDKDKWDPNQILYKYCSAETGISLLKNQKILLRRPDQFNDPFDTFTKITFNFDIRDFPEALCNEVLKLILEKNEPTFVIKNRINEMILKLKAKKIKSIPRALKLKIDAVCAPVVCMLEKQIEIDDAAWRDHLLTWRVFCLSEVKDNLLMWAHYAESHKGVVIGFKCVPEMDSCFCAALPIIYSRNKPSLGTLDYWVKYITGQIPKKHDELWMDLVFTKSIDWCYEKERRYMLSALNQDETYDLRDIDKSEIAEIYMGCRISSTHKDRIIEICHQEYNGIKIYEAVQNEKEFSLGFQEML
jgi:hypothetical protein